MNSRERALPPVRPRRANALRGQVAGARPTAFDVHTAGVRRSVRSGLGHRVPAEPLTEAEDAELLVLPALKERGPDALVDTVASHGHRTAPGALPRRGNGAPRSPPWRAPGSATSTWR
ncbi:hypothetical protein ACIQV3_32905 [Streptomyces sp. NPDC099050]|uniref:hypothetical protein n=1 Tax=Streptomyces sp. NPDC099050 TaxID=3366100 RepID=UPI003807CFBF